METGAGALRRDVAMDPGPRRALHALLAVLAIAGLAAGSARAQPPQRNLVIQVRLVGAEAAADGADDSADGEAPQAAAPNAGYSVGTRPAADAPPAVQTLHVLNGQKGYLRFSNAVPIQWVQAVAVGRAHGAAGSAGTPGASAPAAGDGVAVANGLAWIEAGQSLAVQARWPGGRAPVALEIAIETQAAGAQDGGAPPASARREAHTTVLAPLGHWTTFASVGSAARRAGAARVWSSDPGDAAGPQLFQVMVLAP